MPHTPVDDQLIRLSLVSSAYLTEHLTLMEQEVLRVDVEGGECDRRVGVHPDGDVGVASSSVSREPRQSLQSHDGVLRETRFRSCYCV